MGAMRGGALLALIGAAACGAAPADRSWEVHVPPGLDAAAPAPLVIFVHGYGPGDPRSYYEATWRLREAADARGVLLALPLGTLDAYGDRYFTGAGCCDFYGPPQDDVGFLRSVVEAVAAERAVDPRRVFVLGHSNGGFMAHRMACEAADLVAGIAAVAGHVWKDPERCQPSAPVAVLQVHGDADGNVPYTATDAWPSAPESVATWAAKDGCAGALREAGARRDLSPDLPGAETRVEAFDCAAGAAELWTVEGGGHQPAVAHPGFTEALLDWLLAHPRPAATSS